MGKIHVDSLDIYTVKKTYYKDINAYAICYTYTYFLFIFVNAFIYIYICLLIEIVQ